MPKNVMGSTNFPLSFLNNTSINPLYFFSVLAVTKLLPTVMTKKGEP